MKRRWIVKWYELNLTEEKSRKFFTEAFATLYAGWLEFKYDLKARIYKNL